MFSFDPTDTQVDNTIETSAIVPNFLERYNAAIHLEGEAGDFEWARVASTNIPVKAPGMDDTTIMLVMEFDKKVSEQIITILLLTLLLSWFFRVCLSRWLITATGMVMVPSMVSK